jgi:hypothetical protein
MSTKERQLKDLVSVGPAMLKDFELLGITTVSQLRRRSPEQMYRNLCRLKGQRIDPCCLDVFVAAVAQARDPDLPIAQRQWWYWSRVRKNRENGNQLNGRSRTAAQHSDKSPTTASDNSGRADDQVSLPDFSLMPPG